MKKLARKVLSHLKKDVKEAKKGIREDKVLAKAIKKPMKKGNKK